MGLLEGKTVVVTGGSKGIGKGIARTMGAEGANLVVAGRSSELLEHVVDDLEAHGARALAVTTDVTDPSEIDRLVSSAVDAFGYLDCWVNNAGGMGAADAGPLLELDEGKWDRVIDLNLKWACLLRSGRGSPIDDARRHDHQHLLARRSHPVAAGAPYGAAKAGLEALTRSMATEWGQRGIRVNAIAPGLVTTGDEVPSEAAARRRDRMVEMTPLRRNGAPADIGGTCVFLASDLSAWVTGQVVAVNGGSLVPPYYLPYMRHTNRDITAR
jgi:NAD(P)-dependent dehydrogenase (short-subunit alcohol dehydrogenase family)